MVHFDGVDDYLIAGTAADWTFLHDGSDWTVTRWTSALGCIEHREGCSSSPGMNAPGSRFLFAWRRLVR